jgi:hypothetical protein
MTGGASTYFNYTTDTIMQVHDFLPGLAVLYAASAGTSPTGLTSGTTYFAIPTASGVQLASTKALALAGTELNISSQTYPGSGTFTLTPLDIPHEDTFSFKWQCSNDKVHWYDLDKTSITIENTTTPSHYFWDFGFTTYKYIRCALKAGGFGAIKLKLQGYGKRVAP